jgi:hypothetical protein
MSSGCHTRVPHTICKHICLSCQVLCISQIINYPIIRCVYSTGGQMVWNANMIVCFIQIWEQHIDVSNGLRGTLPLS